MMGGEDQMAATNGGPDRGPADDEALRQGARRRVAPVVSWLLEERLGIGRTAPLFSCFCVRLKEVGIPVDRATIHMPQLHPQLSARSLLWTAETGDTAETGHRHADRASDFYLRSPVRRIFEGGAMIRRRVDPDAASEFPILDDLAAEGHRDYVALPLPFSADSMNAISFATKSENGFDALDVATLEAVLPAFGAIMELNHMRRTASTLLDTYVGRDSGARILSGAVRRGDGEAIHAVVWYCDLRDFTRMSETLSMDQVIALLNDYFERVARPVTARGGEVLKFMGDGMLAIFPCGAGQTASCQAADAAIDAAEEAQAAIAELNEARLDRGEEAIRVGIAISVGEVMYGNVGAADRLDFTVIGPAVNLAARLEPLSDRTDQRIVVSGELARASSRRRFRSLGNFQLKGLSKEQPAFTPSQATRP